MKTKILLLMFFCSGLFVNVTCKTQPTTSNLANSIYCKTNNISDRFVTTNYTCRTDTTYINQMSQIKVTSIILLLDEYTITTYDPINSTLSLCIDSSRQRLMKISVADPIYIAIDNKTNKFINDSIPLTENDFINRNDPNIDDGLLNIIEFTYKNGDVKKIYLYNSDTENLRKLLRIFYELKKPIYDSLRNI